MSEPLLSIEGLEVTYGTGRKAFTAVRGIDLEIGRGETEEGRKAI